MFCIVLASLIPKALKNPTIRLDFVGGPFVSMISGIVLESVVAVVGGKFVVAVVGGVPVRYFCRMFLKCLCLILVLNLVCCCLHNLFESYNKIYGLWHNHSKHFGSLDGQPLL